MTPHTSPRNLSLALLALLPRPAPSPKDLNGRVLSFFPAALDPGPKPASSAGYFPSLPGIPALPSLPPLPPLPPLPQLPAKLGPVPMSAVAFSGVVALLLLLIAAMRRLCTPSAYSSGPSSSSSSCCGLSVCCGGGEATKKAATELTPLTLTSLVAPRADADHHTPRQRSADPRAIPAPVRSPTPCLSLSPASLSLLPLSPASLSLSLALSRSLALASLCRTHRE